MKVKEQTLQKFRKEFIQDHNRGEERFLRGLFIEEFEQFLSEALDNQEKEILEGIAGGLTILYQTHSELKTAINSILYEAQLEGKA